MAKNDSQTIGTIEIQETKTGKRGDMTLFIPPYGALKFSLSEPTEEDKEKMENPPAFWAWNGRNRYGGLWNNTSDGGAEYLSGNFFCLGFPGNKAYVAAFAAKDKPGRFRVVLNFREE